MVREQWVFGGIDTTTRQAFLVPVEQCNADTLLTADNPTVYLTKHDYCFRLLGSL